MNFLNPAKNQLFCDLEAIPSLRLNVFQQSKVQSKETSGVVPQLEQKSKLVLLLPWTFELKILDGQHKCNKDKKI